MQSVKINPQGKNVVVEGGGSSWQCQQHNHAVLLILIHEARHARSEAYMCHGIFSVCDKPRQVQGRSLGGPIKMGDQDGGELVGLQLPMVNHVSAGPTIQTHAPALNVSASIT